MKNTKYILTLLLLLIIVTVNAQEKVTLQLKWTHAFQFAGYYAAVEKGYYFEENLSVNIIQANPETDVVQDVLAGKAEYGVGSSGLLLELAAGSPVVVLAVVFQHSPYRIYTSLDINNLSDLKGKPIMLEPHSEELLAYLMKAGIRPEDLAQVSHSFDANSLIKGETAAMSGYVSSEPYYYNLANFPYRVFSPGSVGIDFYGDNLFTSETELKENPDRVKAFRNASMKGWKYAKEHPQEIIELIYTKYPKQHTRDFLQFESEQMIPLLQPDLIEIGYMNPNRWRHIADTYANIGLLPADFPFDNFIYQPNETDLTIFYRGLIITLLLLIIISLIALYILRVNRKLAHSIDKIQQTNKALVASEQSYFGLFNSISEAIYIQDEEGLFINVNTGAEEMYGYSRKELIGKTPEFLSAPEKNDLALITQLIEKTVRTGESQVFDFWGKRFNGEIFPKEVIINKGKYFGKDVVIATARDVTVRKEAEEMILSGSERLKLLNKIIRHDLSNDFATIKSAVNIYRSTKNEQMIDEIEKRVKKSLRTIYNYREDESFIHSNANINEVEVSETINSIAVDFPEIKVDVQGQCKVFADDALNSVFTNLFSNSIIHGSSTQVDIKITSSNGNCKIMYHDNGKGVPDKIKDKIFDEGYFYGKTGNTGIGLHIVKKTIERYGGTISVKDNDSTGAVFEIKLRLR